MTIEITLCDRLPSRDDLNEVLSEYYDLIVRRMREMGVDLDPAAPQSALREFWDHADDYLPPRGCLAVARTRTGRIVGCGMLKCLDDRTGELKRLYVTSSARGTGAGRRLVEVRVEEARRMGLQRLVVDTLTPNVEMRSLYPKLGFVEVAEPIETTTYIDQPMLRPHMHFFVKDISSG
ncbi:GNAT family N-acetyltransferase [Antarctobacter jejuensis]|uniref:GNAT family N-acetyltransferase n=1 Tax=Antarctobacter jejuensis TaxID=1439938 RepID=UPI003FCFF8EA